MVSGTSTSIRILVWHRFGLLTSRKDWHEGKEGIIGEPCPIVPEEGSCKVCNVFDAAATHEAELQHAKPRKQRVDQSVLPYCTVTRSSCSSLVPVPPSQPLSTSLSIFSALRSEDCQLRIPSRPPFRRPPNDLGASIPTVTTMLLTIMFTTSLLTGWLFCSALQAQGVLRGKKMTTTAGRFQLMHTSPAPLSRWCPELSQSHLDIMQLFLSVVTIPP